uniref:Pilus formation protein N-terminal domain-containing protein n=1 Tax=Panagrolaimus sp. ES5 TaxID=591445 RepID=A0AC34GW27_9BILA
MSAVTGVGLTHSATAQELNVAQETSAIQLGLNQSRLIRLPKDVSDIVMANPNVADAVVRSSRNIYVLGKGVGQTNLVAIDGDGQTVSNITISVERDLGSLRKAIRQYLPMTSIKVAMMNDNVVLSGTASTAGEVEKAASLAEAFLAVGPINNGDGAGNSGYSSIASGNAQGKQSGKIINLVQILGGQQVTLKVTVAEVDRNITKQLGVNLIREGGSGVRFNLLNNAINKGSATLGIGSTLAAYVNAMESAGVMKILAEPTLTAISGESARFKVGGEYNIINSLSENGRDSSSVAQVAYGIGLEFVPVVLSPGRISLKVVTDISEPDESKKEGIPGTKVIQLNRRYASSTIELPSGGSMMIAGLVQDKMSLQRDAVPGLSALPLVGAMFRNDVRKRSEKELVIIVTPYLAEPASEGDLSRPTDNLEFASDASATLLGQVNKVYGHKAEAIKNQRFNGNIGYINK